MDSSSFLKIMATLAMKPTKLSEVEEDILVRGYKNVGRLNIYEFSKREKILPYAANILCSLSLDKEFWINIYRHYEKRNYQIVELTDNIFMKLSSVGVDKIFLYENFGALLASNDSLGCFSSNDIDLFADCKYKGVITDVLKDEGFIPKRSHSSVETVKTEYYNKDLFENGFGINVMWKPLSRLKAPFKLELENRLNWDKLKNFKGTNILLPDNNVLMYLCLLHTSIHGYHRSPGIRLYSDTARLSLLNPDWNRIAFFAQQDKTEVRTATSAILTHKLLGIPLPDSWVSSCLRKHRKIKTLIKRVYNAKHNCLRDEPGGFSVLIIEILSSDYIWYRAFLRIAFPPSDWIREFYLNRKGRLLRGYLMHLRNLI